MSLRSNNLHRGTRVANKVIETASTYDCEETVSVNTTTETTIHTRVERRASVLCLFAVVIAFVGCGGGGSRAAVGSTSSPANSSTSTPATPLSSPPSQPTLLSISIAPLSTNIAIGTTVQLHATGVFSDNSTQDITGTVTWSTTSSAIATVSATGRVNGVSAGAVNISAVSGSMSGSAAIIVSGKSLLSLSVTAASNSVPIGATDQFTATGIFSDGSSQDLTGAVTWSSSGPAAMISSAGLATGQLSGTVNIQASSNNVTGAMTLTVSPAVLTAMSVSPDPSTLPIGGSVQFVATGTFTDGTTQDLTGVNWSSSSSAVATIDAHGVATGVSAGTATLTASLGAFYDTASVNVLPASLVSISVSAPQSTMAAGTSQQFKVTGTFSDGSTQDLPAVTWGSSNASVATVNVSGFVSAATAGTTVIIASAGSISGSLNITVTGATLTSIVVTPAVPQLALGLSIQFSATGVFSDSTIQDITSAVVWSSSDASVATVSNTGLVVALGAGTATISATAGTVSGASTLDVISVNLASIAISPSSATFAKGTSLQLALVGTFTDGSTQPLAARTWRSSSPNIASVRKNGVVRGKRAGSATITATYGLLSATARLTVSSANLLSVAISPINPSIAANTKQQFQVIGTYQGGFTQDVTAAAHWSASNAAVATVSNSSGTDGLATSYSGGTSTITASLGTQNGSTVLTVTTATLVSIAVTPANSSIVLGRSQQFVATGSFSDATSQDISNSVIWTSSHPSVAVISGAGLATSAGVGSTAISASSAATIGSTVLTVQ